MIVKDEETVVFGNLEEKKGEMVAGVGARVVVKATSFVEEGEV